MPVKECGSHASNSPRLLNFLGRNIICLVIFIIVTIIGIALAWVILHSPKPRFILQDATVFSFNVSGDPPDLLTSSIQTTLISRNLNGKTGINYDRLDVYASYQSQQITLPTSIPAAYQGYEEVNVWSPFIGGKYVPIARANALSLVQEQSSGAVKVLVHVVGKISWKVGPITRTSDLFVRCPALISFGNSAAGVIVGGRGVKYTLVTVCSVSV
ncbi:NDR1/HIN1-like protein 1 [Brassica rapa]|uniref:Late embryogenesis abundant protein LEA-2 subgroup domain-containing protein n=1 Tax=Brassica campestris TaxID=3711 RepID=M4CNV4_BRACM|nr:NDR1/HIN1-like protein 1 [Brassica rapa]